MPRIYRTQKEQEQLLIREFLCDLGYRMSNPRWQESPDVLLTLSKGKCKKRVAIEHTGYFNDTVAGKRSPLTPIADFWKSVQYSLIRRISHRKHLTGILARVEFKSNLPKPENPTKLARQLAKELVDFVEGHPVSKPQHLHFRRRDFGTYPTLRSLLDALSLTRRTHDSVRASRSSWLCSNIAGGGFSFNLDYIKTAIENKNKKALKYNWGRADEKWLLIAASGGSISNRAVLPTQNGKWADDDLMELCQISPFDKIIFWERIRCWYKCLKPNKPVVQYKNPNIKRSE